jgi:hypothetical protein
MGSHLFISHSRQDDGYVRRLAGHLRAEGLPTWYDEAISVGDRFSTEIQQQIDTCFALIVVLTPASAASRWVLREISYADDLDKPVLPLLLAACVPPILLQGIQREDVTGGRLPGDRFIERLQGLMPATGRPAIVTVAPRAPVSDDQRDKAAILDELHDAAVATGKAGDPSAAVNQLREVVSGRTWVLGADHSDTLNSRYWLARFVGLAGDPAEAARLMREVATDQARVLGPHHPVTTNSEAWVANFLGQQHKSPA